MKLKVLEKPNEELVEYLDRQIKTMNWQHWEVKERLPLAVQVTDEMGRVLAGAVARTFGDWLLLDTLWVSESLRGQKMGSQILNKIETAAQSRGCNKVWLETLSFQARPFYEKHGYQIHSVQENYPKTSCQYFMVKQL